MFVVFLKFGKNKALAAEFMDGHNSWVERGFNDGIFILAGSLQPNLGGSILAYNTSLSELEERVNNDPFVKENIVTAEIFEVSPARTDQRLHFLNE